MKEIPFPSGSIEHHLEYQRIRLQRIEKMRELLKQDPLHITPVGRVFAIEFSDGSTGIWTPIDKDWEPV
jgi:hypothetical protein